MHLIWKNGSLLLVNPSFNYPNLVDDDDNDNTTIDDDVALSTDVVQFFLIPVVLGEGLFALIAANALYAGALSWYWYITHLGYRTLPFLSSTEVFLFPIAAVVLLFVTMIVGYPFGFGWNAARVMARFYFT